MSISALAASSVDPICSSTISTRPSPACLLGVTPSAVFEKTWARLDAVLSDERPNGPVAAASQAEVCRLIIVLQEVGGRLNGRIDAAKPPGRRDRRPAIFYVPAGSCFHASAATLRSARILTLRFDRHHLAALTSNDLPPRGLLAPRGFFDARLMALAQVFEAECLSSAAPDPVLGESLAMSLLSILNEDPMPSSEPAVRGLASKQLSRVTAHIDRNLTEPVAAADLARLVGLSPGHFCRAFKISTGLPPHSWLMARRVEQAKALMRGSLSLVQVALATGFSDQPHFTRTFTRLEAMSPGVWRRDHAIQGLLALAG